MQEVHYNNRDILWKDILYTDVEGLFAFSLSDSWLQEIEICVIFQGQVMARVTLVFERAGWCASTLWKHGTLLHIGKLLNLLLKNKVR